MAIEALLVSDKRFYEPVDGAAANAEDFLEFAQRLVDDKWSVVRHGVWTNFIFKENDLPVQGWKIHLSSVPADARMMLEAVVPVLVELKVSFKFLTDRRTLLMTSANFWERGGSGKFFTIYPTCEAHFKRLLAVLYPLTKRFRGPYVLSDRRYRDSKTLYYRYGGLRRNDRLRPDGGRKAVLVAPDGREIEDKRGPVYSVPDWVRDPFPPESEPESKGLNGGRYRIEKALSFSNSGGVYVALDAATGRRVVLKEARAHVHNFAEGVDAADMLRHEYRVLRDLEEIGAAPTPVELFVDWEHLYLAEEYFDGYMPLKRFSALPCTYLETRPTKKKVERILRRDLRIARRLSDIVEAMHARGVVWGDVSENNILIHPETLDVKIIDLESACRVGETPLVRIVTPGFVPPDTAPGSVPTREDDYYSVGAVLANLITHSNPRLAMQPDARKKALRSFEMDFGLPRAVTQVIKALTAVDAASRPRPSEALRAATADAFRVGAIGCRARKRVGAAQLRGVVERGVRFIKANADFRRRDRLFPADPAVYATNPSGVAHGAAGVAYALNAIEGCVDEAVVRWLEDSELSARALPPGLFNGLAGVAWTLLELGRVERARAVFEESAGHPLLRRCANYRDGKAGWGMTALRFWTRTGERGYLEAAVSAGRELIASAIERPEGLCWPDEDGTVFCGLGLGAAGIGLFLLYLEAAAGDGAFLRAAVRALDFDLAHGKRDAEGRLSFPRGAGKANIVSPYLNQGSAGVGAAALRFWTATGERRYLRVVRDLLADCDRKYTLYPGRRDGLAGIGEFLLDAHRTTGDVRFLDGAHRVAEGLSSFEIRDGQCSAFPGNGLARISCDYSTGSAGVLSFLDRLARPRPADFLVDELLQ